MATPNRIDGQGKPIVMTETDATPIGETSAAPNQAAADGSKSSYRTAPVPANTVGVSGDALARQAVVFAENEEDDPPEISIGELLDTDPQFVDPESGISWISASKPEVNFRALVEDDMVGLYANAIGRILGDKQLADAEKVIQLSLSLYVLGTRYSVQFFQGVVPVEETHEGDDWSTRIANFASMPSNSLLQLAASLALAYHGRLDEIPFARIILETQGLTFPNTVIRLKTAIALLYDGSEESTKMVERHFVDLPAHLQDRIINEICNRADRFQTGWGKIITLYVAQSTISGQQNNPETILRATRKLNLIRFAQMLGGEPKLLSGAKLNYIRGASLSGQHFAGFVSVSSPEDIDDDVILSSEINLTGAAIYIFARHPELQGTDIFGLAREVVAAEIGTVVDGKGGIIHEAEMMDRQKKGIPSDDIATAFSQLLSDNSPDVRVRAARGILIRDHEGVHADEAYKTILDIFRRNDLEKIVTGKTLGLVANDYSVRKELEARGFFKDEMVLKKLVSLAKPNTLNPTLAHMAFEAAARNADAETVKTLLESTDVDAITGSGYSSDYGTNTWLLEVAITRIAQGCDHTTTIEFFRKQLATSKKTFVKMAYATGLAFLGEFNAPGQREAFRRAIESDLRGLDEQNRKIYLFEKSIETLSSWELAAIAIARKGISGRLNFEMFIREMLHTSIGSERYQFGWHVLGYGLAADINSTFFAGKFIDLVGVNHRFEGGPLTQVGDLASHIKTFADKLEDEIYHTSDWSTQFSRKEKFASALSKARARKPDKKKGGGGESSPTPAGGSTEGTSGSGTERREVGGTRQEARETSVSASDMTGAFSPEDFVPNKKTAISPALRRQIRGQGAEDKGQGRNTRSARRTTGVLVHSAMRVYSPIPVIY